MPLNKTNSADFRHNRNVSKTTQLLSIDKLVQEVIATYQREFFGKNIVVETDLSPINAAGDAELIKSAFSSLMVNATSLMNNGGAMTVTLVDGNHQWELEVAESSDAIHPENRSDIGKKTAPMGSAADGELPTIIPFPESQHLRDANRAAMSHGGHVQTWDCPQGGMAYVLVIPKPGSSFPA